MNQTTKRRITRNGARAELANGHIESARPTSCRLAVLKTYKIYIGGKFPRTESGRYDLLRAPDGTALANMCKCSRKDVRDSVVAARAAFGGWSARSAYNRGQILYRIAEMLEGRSGQFVDELVLCGAPEAQAKREVAATIDRFVYYAGWADKYQQIFSCVNPVASSHFNFSVLEPTGVVSVLASDDAPLLGISSLIGPAITGGNTVVAIASEKMPLCAVTLAEVLATSDLPGGVVNILTGQRSELLDPITTHMDVNAIVYAAGVSGELAKARTNAALNIKRVINSSRADWLADAAQSPYTILETQEVKTTWHPIGV